MFYDWSEHVESSAQRLFVEFPGSDLPEVCTRLEHYRRAKWPYHVAMAAVRQELSGKARPVGDVETVQR